MDFTLMCHLISLNLVFLDRFSICFTICSLQGWLLGRNAQEADVLLNLFDALFEDVYNYANNNLHGKMLLLQCMQIKQVRLGNKYVYIQTDHMDNSIYCY